MKRKIKRYIEEHKLLSPKAKVIVGLSGGADSVVLLSILHDLGYECLAAHCNFHLRGEESQRDEKFAASFASDLGISFFKISFDTTFIAQENGISIEMAARDLRYDWFEQLKKEWEAEAILVAHHQDDSIETALLNLIRGTGINGLTGIKPKNGDIVRPLLCVSKEDILNYAERENIPYIVDSSNLEDEFMRNKIRLQILPLLKSLNPAINTALLQTIENLNEAAKVYNSSIQEVRKRVFDSEKQLIDIPLLLTFPSPESLLFEILKEYGFGKETVKEVYRSTTAQSGKEFYSEQYRLVKDRTCFLLTPLFQKEQEQELVFEILDKTSDFQIVKDANVAYFDAEKLTFPLTIRKWETGDRFVPFGMNGSQKLSDYFNNHKFSKPEKENVRLLCSGDAIIWVIGHRTDNRFRVVKETKKVFVAKLS